MSQKFTSKNPNKIDIDLTLSDEDDDIIPLIQDGKFHPVPHSTLLVKRHKINTILKDVKNSSMKSIKRKPPPNLQNIDIIKPPHKRRKLNLKIPKFNSTNCNPLPEVLTLRIINQTGDRKLKTIGKNDKFKILMHKCTSNNEFEFILNGETINLNSTPNHHHHIHNYDSIYLKEIRTHNIGNDIIYKSNEKILFLGEMDFSLSNSMANLIGGENIISTSYWESIATIKCQLQAQQNITSLQSFKATVLHGIDATTLKEYQSRLKCDDENVKVFDKIIFAFPYSTEAKKDEKHLENQRFMKSVFKSCKDMVKLNGEFHVLLNINDNRSQINAWNINYIDWKCEKQHKMNKNELYHIFPGYIVHDTKGYRWDYDLTSCAMYVFQPCKLT